VRPVKKGAPPAELTNWLASLPAGYQPGWKEIPTADKDATKRGLLREQFFLCCYCERRVTMPDSHIEHREPQSAAPAGRFNFGNLLASCQGESKRGKAPETCGHVRGERALPVHPLMPDCGAYFIFDSAGRISPCLEQGREQPARETIRVLKLDAANLNQARRAALVAVDDVLVVANDEMALRAEAQGLLASCATPDQDGRLAPFLSAIEQYLKGFI
jgi:uncharacterized protein (TIGR02646 family)